jgi:hypothetical protein
VTSQRKLAANRANGRKSRGPVGVVGKSRASRNALRHGLAAVTHRNPVFYEEIARMAQAICGSDSDPLLFEQALQIAESGFLLQCVRIERVAAIERLRDVWEVPLAKGDNRLASAKARIREQQPIYDEFDKIEARLAAGENPSDPLPEPMQSLWPAPAQERDEFSAMEAAMPDLERLARYERRAWSRRKQAVRAFIAIKSMNACGDRERLSSADQGNLTGSCGNSANSTI